MSAFVSMYNPALPGSPHVLAPVRAEALYAAHGWLVVDGSTPPPEDIYLTSSVGDQRYAKVADIGDPATTTGTTLRSAFVPKWKPSTAYASGEFVLNPSGQVVSANTAFTSGTTYSSSNWTIVTGGGVAPSGATVVVGTGTADSTAITAAFNSMKVGGHATGTLKLVGTFALNTDLVLDGGYASVTQGANWVSGSTERFVLDASAASLVPAATSACALTVKGFYGGVFRVGFKGGGARRTFADGAITSGSNLFTSAQVANAVVGQYVRIEGAGFLGEVPMQATIVSIAGTTATLSDTATTTVSGATGAISSIALHQENLIDAETDVYANGFAGLVHHIDTQNSTAKYVTQSTLRSLKTLSCGQALGWKNVQGGVGAILDAWDDNSADGMVQDNCADVTISHWETYNPSTQTVGALISQGQDYDAFLSLGDAASEALLKIVGGDLKKFRVRAGGRTNVTAGTGTVDGIKLVEVKSIDLEALTLRCANGVHIKGGGQNSVKIRHFSQTSDTVPLYVEAGPSTAAPVIDYDGRTRFTGSQSAFFASSLTGGRTTLRGYIDSSVNQAGAGTLYAVDCQSTAHILDVAGLTQANKGSGIAGGVNHVTPTNLIGVETARLGNGPTVALGALPTAQITAQTSLSNSTTETALGALTIPANTVAAGQTYRIIAGGTMDVDATGGGNITFRVRVGGVTGTSILAAAITLPATLLTGKGWRVEAEVVFRAASSASVPTIGQARAEASLSTYATVLTGPAASNIGTTTTKDLALCAVYSVAATGHALRTDYCTITQVK